jgi:hypothetical protein
LLAQFLAPLVGGELGVRAPARFLKGRGKLRGQPPRGLYGVTGPRGLLLFVAGPPAGGGLLAQFPAPLVRRELGVRASARQGSAVVAGATAVEATMAHAMPAAATAGIMV